MSTFSRFLKITIQEDFRFPVAEIFAFLMALAPLTLYVEGANYASLSDSQAFSYFSSALGLSGFLFLIMIFKNISFGLGSDLEKGVTNSFLTFPISRGKYLTAKLISGALLPFLMFMVAPLPLVIAYAPNFGNYGALLLYWAITASGYMVIIGLMNLVAMATKKGATSLIAGLGLYFAAEFASGFALFFAARGNRTAFYAISLLNPSELWTSHYRMLGASLTVSTGIAASLTIASALLGIALLLASYASFEKVVQL
ncbi:MAG: hypothetical protein ACP5TI_05835 [Thermoprotei archaeon]